MRMRILLVGDEPCKALWDYYDGKCLKGFDLILSSGDLPPQYLSFLVTFANCPLLYVHGNHDGVYDIHKPEGCICVDDKVYVHEGVRILGLGGSANYNNGPYQWTERQMKRRVRRALIKASSVGGIDILLTHAPARGYGDLDDLPHRGFEAFFPLLDRYSPKYMAHGHVHLNYGYHLQRINTYKATRIINCFQRYTLYYE